MIKTEYTKKREVDKKVYIAVGVGVIFITGLVLGGRNQRKISAKELAGVVTMTKDLSPMFPDTMPIAEIKEALKLIEGAEFRDALLTVIDGVGSLIVR